jgi:hypothetical protein
MGADLTMRDILDVIEVHAGLRNLDPAPHIAGAKKRFAVRIRDRQPIHSHLIVVKARILWRGDPGKEAIFSLGEGRAEDADALHIRSAHTEMDPPLSIDTGPILADDSR